MALNPRLRSGGVFTSGFATELVDVSAKPDMVQL